MARPVSGTVKTSQVKVKQKNGDIYVLERKSVYDPEKGYTKSLGTRLIGKIPAGQSEMVPTRPRKNKAETAPVVAIRQRVGLTQILQWIGEASGIDEDLYSATDTATAQKILTLAQYWLANEGKTLPHIEKWQMTHPTAYAAGLSESNYSRLFDELGRDEQVQQNYFKNRALRLDDAPSIAFDSTTISTYSHQQIDARQGFNKAEDGLNTVKLLTLYSVKTRQPIAFNKQPGNLPDVTSLENALNELTFLDLIRPLIVTDNGYYSQSNITEMTRRHKQFLTLASIDIKWIGKHLNDHREELETAGSLCPWDSTIHGITVPVMHEITWQRERNRGAAQAGEVVKESHRYYLHFFLNRTNVARDDQRLMEDLWQLKQLVSDGVELSDSAQKNADRFLIVHHRGRGGRLQVQFNEEAIKEARKNYGYFVLISNKAMDCFQALEDYRLREKIEEAFKVHKDRLDGSRTRVWFSESLRGRMFVQFVALGYYCFLMSKIKELKETLGTDPQLTQTQRDDELGLKRWLEQRSLGQILDWFDCQEETCIQTETGRKRWTSENTQRDRLLLSKLGIQ